MKKSPERSQIRQQPVSPDEADAIKRQMDKLKDGSKLPRFFSIRLFALFRQIASEVDSEETPKKA